MVLACFGDFQTTLGSEDRLKYEYDECPTCVRNLFADCHLHLESFQRHRTNSIGDNHVDYK